MKSERLNRLSNYKVAFVMRSVSEDMLWDKINVYMMRVKLMGLKYGDYK